MRSLAALLALLAWGCDLSGPLAQRPHGPSRLPVGPLTLSTWLPAGLEEVRLSEADQRLLADLGLTHVEWLQRAEVDGRTAEELAMSFCAREGLAMPVYYEAPGFTPYDKLHNWAARAAVGEDFDGAVRQRVLALKARWAAAPAFAGYLVGHEDYRAETYPALARTVRVLREEDAQRPALAVGRIGNYPQVERFLDALFGEGGEPNVFQHEDYAFAADVPAAGRRLQARLDGLAEGYGRVARHLRDRNGRWHAIVQVHGETRGGEGYYRAPAGPEISVQAGLALSRGASGVVYFLYSSGTEHVRDASGQVVQVREYSGLVDRDGAPTARYAAVQRLNRRLRVVGAALADLYFRGGYPARQAPADEPVGSGEPDLDLGFFGDGAQTSHVLVVNRRSDEGRQALLEVAEGVDLADVESGAVVAVSAGTARLDLAAGGFRLLAASGRGPGDGE